MKNEKNLYIMVGVISAVVCAFVYFTKSPGNKGTKVTFGQVDQLRKETQIRNEMSRSKVSVENYNSAPTLSNSYRPVDEVAPGKSGIVLESEQHSAIKSLAEDEEPRRPTNMLEAQINKKLLNDQRAAQMSALQKKAFISAYKKKALSEGYEVELSEELIVTSVKKVSKKAPASLSPQEDINIQEEEFEDNGE